jgi:hypothetical protein
MGQSHHAVILLHWLLCCLRAGSYVAIQAPLLKLRGIGGVCYKILALLRKALEASGQTG